MSFARSMSVTVDMGSFGRALQAVLPHASTDPEVPRLARARFYVGVDDVVVAAANGRTAAMGRVGLFDNGASELGCFDLTPADAKQIQGLFKAAKGSGENSVLRIDTAGDFITLTDVSGMFPGKAYKLPTFPVDDMFPDLAKLFGPLVQTGRPGPPDEAQFMFASAQALASFQAAGRAYSEPLVVEPVGRALSFLVSCGPAFMGFVSAQWVKEDDRQAVARDRKEWADVFLDVSASHPVHSGEGDDAPPVSDQPVGDWSANDIDNYLWGGVSEKPVDLADADAGDVQEQAAPTPGADFLRNGKGVHLGVVRDSDEDGE